MTTPKETTRGGDCACGHPKSTHGRRGYGSCGVTIPTDHMVELAKKWAAESPDIAGRLVATALCLPGMSDDCGCKRFHVRAAHPSKQAREQGEPE